MNLLEKIWLIIALIIIIIILFTDPKGSESSYGNSALLGVFSSVSKGEKFINRLNWGLIISFFIITTLISYLA